MDISLSVNGVPIRLTAERWLHIVENHDDMAGYFDDVLEVIDNPELILPGHHGALIAIRGYGPSPLLKRNVPRKVWPRWFRHHRLRGGAGAENPGSTPAALRTHARERGRGNRWNVSC